MSNIFLTLRAPSALSVRYDAPPPGRPHEGAVSLAMPDGGLFAIFSHPDESEQIARELLAQTEKWREAIDGPNGPDTGRHAHIVVDGTETAELPVYTDDEPAYPDPAALQAQAAAEMEAAAGS